MDFGNADRERIFAVVPRKRFASRLQGVSRCHVRRAHVSVDDRGHAALIHKRRGNVQAGETLGAGGPETQSHRRRAVAQLARGAEGADFGARVLPPTARWGGWPRTEALAPRHMFNSLLSTFANSYSVEEFQDSRFPDRVQFVEIDALLPVLPLQPRRGPETVRR